MLHSDGSLLDLYSATYVLGEPGPKTKTAQRSFLEILLDTI